MSSTVRNLVLATAMVAVTGATFAARQGLDHEVGNPLSIRMLADSSGSNAFMGTVEFRVSNNSNEVLKVPYWQLPGASNEGKLFQVFREGKAAQYLGPMIKRAAPTEADMVTFQPYETKLFSIDLSKTYDLGQTGEYTVSFVSFLEGARTSAGRKLSSGNGRMATLQSVPLKLWVDSSNKLKGLGNTAQAKPGSGGTPFNGVTYVGCSSTQITGGDAAIAQARAYSQDGRNYLTAGTQGPRYTTWFGAYTSARYATMQQHFVDIDNALDQSGGQMKINCGCNQSYYAYVYPTKPYEIFVCRAFWTAPNAGTDSRGGTLIHETSHFNVVASTDDWVYGQAGAKNLALTNPTNAIDNADSHEYFAENTPNQN